MLNSHRDEGWCYAFELVVCVPVYVSSRTQKTADGFRGNFLGRRLTGQRTDWFFKGMIQIIFREEEPLISPRAVFDGF